MKKIIALLLFLQTSAYAQVIKGTVRSEGKYIGYANVGVEGTTLGTIATETGEFELRLPSVGTYKIRVSAIGYASQTRKVTVNTVTTVNLELTPSANQLNDVVVSGTMKETSRLNTPVPVEIYTPKFFLKNPTNNLFDAMQMVNGVQPTLNCNVCNTGDIHINGMEGPYTMVLIDGMPIVSSLATVYGLMGIPNSMIERVEVVKGPASTLYGSEAVAGLINVITKKPEKAPRLSADIFTTGYREWNADAAIAYRLGKVNGLLSTNLYSMNHRWDVNNDLFTDLTLQRRGSVFGKWSLQRKHNREATLAVRLMAENRWGGEMNWNESFKGTDSVYGETISTQRLEIIGAYHLPLRPNIKWMYSYTDHAQQSYYGTVPFNAQQRIAFNQLVWDSRKGRHDFLAGAALRYTYYDDNSVATASADTNRAQNAPLHTWLPGIFLQDEISITSSHTLLLGIRYDYFNTHGSIVSPRINYRWKPTPTQTLRVSAGNGFRVVNLFTEDHAALTGSRKVEIRESLNPETSWNINLNYTRFVNHKVGFTTLDGSLFYTYFTNRITADYDTDPNKIIYDNLNGYAVSRGVSLNMEHSFTFPLRIQTGMTWMQVYQREENATGTIQTVKQLHAPEWSGTFQVGYTFHRYRLTIDWTGQVYGPMRLPVLPNDYRPEYSPWFTLQNIQFTYKFPKAVQLYGGIKNILNFLPDDPIMRPFDPFDKRVSENNPNGYTFDPSYNYAPIQGIRWFFGIRYVLQ